jgi:hypothetical protein
MPDASCQGAKPLKRLKTAMGSYWKKLAWIWVWRQSAWVWRQLGARAAPSWDDGWDRPAWLDFGFRLKNSSYM